MAEDWIAARRRYTIGVAVRAFTIAMVVIDLVAIGAAAQLVFSI